MPSAYTGRHTLSIEVASSFRFSTAPVAGSITETRARLVTDALVSKS